MWKPCRPRAQASLSKTKPNASTTKQCNTNSALKDQVLHLSNNPEDTQTDSTHRAQGTTTGVRNKHTRRPESAFNFSSVAQTITMKLAPVLGPTRNQIFGHHNYPWATRNGYSKCDCSGFAFYRDRLHTSRKRLLLLRGFNHGLPAKVTRGQINSTGNRD